MHAELARRLEIKMAGINYSVVRDEPLSTRERLSVD